MSENKAYATVSGNFSTLLLVLFIGLKLAGVGVVATWSWWWVLAPAWIPLALVLLVLAGVFSTALCVGILDEIHVQKRISKARKAKKLVEQATELERKAHEQEERS